jgi:hypothetical protein
MIHGHLILHPFSTTLTDAILASPTRSVEGTSIFQPAVLARTPDYLIVLLMRLRK